jgi:hypothetical protein
LELVRRCQDAYDITTVDAEVFIVGLDLEDVLFRLFRAAPDIRIGTWE